MQINFILFVGKTATPEESLEIITANKFRRKFARRVRFLSALSLLAMSWLIECTIRSRQSLRQMMINGATSPRKRARSLNRPRNLELFGSIPAFGTASEIYSPCEHGSKIPELLPSQIYMAILFSGRNSVYAPCRSSLIPLDSAFPLRNHYELPRTNDR